jgi:predicted nuclease with TOPRIM domain
MKLEELKKKHEAIAEKTSALLAEIEAKENEILSITERLEEINILKGEDIKAQKARAKEKRARLRDEITDLRHNVRLLDGQKEWLMIKAKALL